MNDGGNAMNFLKQERQTLEKLLPGLDAALAEFALMEMERPGNPSIPAVRWFGGPGLLIPERFGGRGASPLQAVRAQRAIACRAPSLAVATTMHHFTLAALMEIDLDNPDLEGELLTSVARDNLYMGSGFAESQPATSIQTSALRMYEARGGSS
jgi:alkylation response protein AidB-like acyl-CoA dehydrogenase